MTARTARTRRISGVEDGQQHLHHARSHRLGVGGTFALGVAAFHFLLRRADLEGRGGQRFLEHRRGAARRRISAGGLDGGCSGFPVGPAVRLAGCDGRGGCGAGGGCSRCSRSRGTGCGLTWLGCSRGACGRSARGRLARGRLLVAGGFGRGKPGEGGLVGVRRGVQVGFRLRLGAFGAGRCFVFHSSVTSVGVRAALWSAGALFLDRAYRPPFGRARSHPARITTIQAAISV